MDTSNRGKWGVVSMGLVVAGLWGGFGCTSEPTDPDGSGGATGGQGDGGTGGGSGGSGGGSGGACNVNGGGGAIYLYNCDEWLGVRTGGEIDFSCGQGGQGGNGGEGGALGGDEPALQRVCENESNPDFNRAHPVYHCLSDLTDNVCSTSHDEDVVACLTQEPSCDANLEAVGCDDIMDECAEIDEGTCYWGMVSARNPNYVETCFAASKSGEACDARFMRCAWGL